MAAWPQFVPRIELDVHLKAIEERFSEFSQRIGGQQEHNVRANAEVERLDTWCKGFACKADVNHLGSRLDLQIACTDSSLVEGLQDIRDHSFSEVQKLREELQAQIDALKAEATRANKEFVRLEEAVAKEPDFIDATYATKAEVATIRPVIERRIDVIHAQLVSAIDAVEIAKASRAELDETKVALRSSDEALANDLEKTSASLSQTTQSLVFFDKLCRDTFATKGAVSDVSGSVTDLAQQVSQLSSIREDVQSQIDGERERLRENIGEVQECWKIVKDATDDIYNLKVGRSFFVERCEKSEQGLQSLTELEKTHWDECQAAVKQQSKAHEDLQAACAVLRKDMELHIEAAQQEAEKLRQHSTMRYLDQMDKALGLQQTMDHVQRDNQELQQSLSSIRLPKMA